MDNFNLLIEYKNGDVANISYSGQGNAFPNKETLEIIVAGQMYSLIDFKNFYSSTKDGLVDKKTFNDKGFSASMDSFFEAVRGNSFIASNIHDWEKVHQIIDLMRNNNIG